MAFDTVLLQGPMRGLFHMIEVPLYVSSRRYILHVPCRRHMQMQGSILVQHTVQLGARLKAREFSAVLLCDAYRSASLIRINPSSGPYSRLMPRALRGT